MFKNIKGCGFLFLKSFCWEVESLFVIVIIGIMIYNFNCDGVVLVFFVYVFDFEFFVVVFFIVLEVSVVVVVGCCKVLVGRELSLIEVEVCWGYRGSVL